MQTSIWILVGIAAFASFFGATDGNKIHKCPKHEVYKDCKSPCDGTCENPKGTGKYCPPGCYCADGYVRDENGKCILKKDCPPECCENEVYKDCKSPCDGTCKHPKGTGKYCPPGCYCADGYVRDENGKCILKKDCPPECCENEVYKDCKSPCDGTCKHPKGTGKYCPPGCYCADGYVRDENGKCILKKDCPPECCENEVYKDCTSPCDGTCKHPKGTGKHCPPGCYCADGYVRDENGKCILKKECPQECCENEVYKDCDSPCDGTCDCPEGTGKLCPPGCYCADGYVRDKHGKCVCVDDCKPKHKCGKHEVYQECGTACETTCANQHKKIACTLQCVKGCFCEKGYIRAYKDKTGTGPCIKPSKCPKDCKDEKPKDIKYPTTYPNLLPQYQQQYQQQNQYQYLF